MSDDYDVGYKKPPREHQFRKGQSGNSKGRAKKKTIYHKESIESLFLQLYEELHRTVKVKVAGRDATMAKSQIMMRTLVDKAAKGDEASSKLVMKNFSRHPRG